MTGSNGSRILVTSRIADVVPNAKPHFLRFLTEKESWKILHLKVFKHVKGSSDYLAECKQIVKKCQGLPLAVVVAGGLLANMSLDQWKTVVRSGSSFMVGDTEDLMETLSLSYKNLPHPLKACFLYLGAFPEDYEIRVQIVICLWIAQGFIRQTGQKCLESYLMDLIDRSLVTVAQRRSDGSVKSCRIHDLLRDFCIRKAREENFLHKIFRFGPSSLCMRTYLWFSSWSQESYDLLTYRYDDLSYCLLEPLLLRVLDLWSPQIRIGVPDEVGSLVHLRYLAIRNCTAIEFSTTFLSSISELWNLETLVVGGPLELPFNLGKMVKLRHLIIEAGTCILPHVKEPTSYKYPFKLINLQSVSTLFLNGSSEEVFSRIPMIRKLGCAIIDVALPFSESSGVLHKFDILIHLETLKVTYPFFFLEWPPPRRCCSSFTFPSTLRKLTISCFELPWTDVSIIGTLPKLEVLKLRLRSFTGPVWNTNDGEFVQLKFLKLEDLDIEQWNAEASHFPVLQRLVIVRCNGLKDIPSDLGDISSLEKIEVWFSNSSAADSARQIQEAQQYLGNDVLKVTCKEEISLAASDTKIIEPFGGFFKTYIDKLFWQRVWRLQVPPSVRMLIWRICQKAMPVRVDLVAHDTPAETSCWICSLQKETVIHCLRDCSFARATWFLSPLGCRVSQLHHVSLKDWLVDLMTLLSSELVDLWAMVVHGLWIARNKWLHEGIEPHPQKIIHEAVGASELFRKANAPAKASVPVGPLISRWFAPAEDWVKLNVDATVNSDGYLAVGAVLRNAKGEVLVFFMEKLEGHVEIEVAKAIAVYKGLLLTIGDVHDKAVIETECFSLVEKLQNRSRVEALLDDILLLVACLKHVEFFHVGREGNKMAHRLAAIALSRSECFSQLWRGSFSS